MSPKYIVIDLFCGAGGTTTGFDMAMINGRKAAHVVACVNHDPLAIKSHWENHPEVKHFEEDIRTLDLTELVAIAKYQRDLHPTSKLILWASLECTNFSKAKGGQARDADSRTLADHLDRYVVALDPDYIQIENVVEFMSWGPMVNGKPVSRKNGQDWIRWKQHICSHGYRDEWRELNSADFGAYTSRNRLFGIFAKPGLPIVWPKPTHAKNPSKGSMFGDLKKWMPVKHVIDFADEGHSILNRKKPLVDPSLERIEAGLIKYVAGGKEAFVLKYNSLSKAGKHVPPSVDEPCPTIACQNRLGIVNTSFIAKYYSGLPTNHIKSVNEPVDSLTTIDHHSLVNTSFIAQRNTGNPESKVISTDGPARTVTGTGGNQDVVQVQPVLRTAKPFLMASNGGHKGSKVFPVDSPCRVITTADNKAVVSPAFLTQYYSSGGQLGSIEEPARTLGTRDTIAKIQTEWIERQFGKSQVSSVESPAGTLMPNDKHRLISCDPFILNPSHGGHTTSTDQPCPVIIARQDKAPLYLIQFDMDPNICIPVYEEDSPVMVRIKIFMSMYGIADIKMRMLKVPELLRIQGFPANYKLAGNQSDQKKFIGNSVVPHVVKAWTESLAA